MTVSVLLEQPRNKSAGFVRPPGNPGKPWIFILVLKNRWKPWNSKFIPGKLRNWTGYRIMRKLQFNVIYGLIGSKTCQPLTKIVLFILNTPGKRVKKVLDFLNYEGVRTLCLIISTSLFTYKLLTIKLVANLRTVRTQLVNGLFADLLQVVRFLRMYK